MSFWEQGKALLIAVYGEQMVVSVDVAEGRIGKESGRVIFKGNGPVVSRQEASHPHFVKWMPGGVLDCRSGRGCSIS